MGHNYPLANAYAATHCMTGHPMTRPFLRLRPTGPQWPYSAALLREDEPRLSVSSNPHPGELASYADLDPPILVYQVTEVDPPAMDPRTQRLNPADVELIEQEWRQVWTVRDATEQEVAEFDEANRPPPRWTEFGAALQVSTPVNQLTMTALHQAPPLALGLAIGLSKAADGQPEAFLNSWSIARSLGMISPPLVDELAELGRGCDLPPTFVAALEAV